MVDLGAQSKSAGAKRSAVPGPHRRSVKVVTAERNQQYLQGLVSWIPVFRAHELRRYQPCRLSLGSERWTGRPPLEHVYVIAKAIRPKFR
jgi:hypothetical protein